MSTLPTVALVYCEVFREEIAIASAGATHIRERIEFEIGLHDHPPKMRVCLQEVIDKLEARNDITAVLLAYGLCGHGTAGLRARRHSLVLPRAHDCISVFLGGADIHAARQSACPGCHYYTCGWNRARRVPGPERTAALREEYARRFDEETVDFLLDQERELWSHYDTAAFIDTGTANTETEAAYTRKCAQSLGWRYEEIAGDRSFLHQLLWGPWDNGRFIQVAPGRQVAVRTDGSVMTATE